MTHQKRLPAPKHYPIERKETKYVSTIKGSRSSEDAIPAVVLLRDVLGYADTEKEAKEIVRNGDMERNGDRIRDIKEGIGIMDVVKILEKEEKYRTVRRGKYLEFVPVEDSRVAAKITGKDSRGEEYVYRLHSGENYRTGDEYSTGNTLVFDGSVKEVELKEGAEVLVIRGRHAGEVAEVVEMEDEGIGRDAIIENEQEIEIGTENLIAIEDLKVIGDE
ncbi:MAG: KOW motif-containing protein [Candidatus Nanohaloarchaea archaeon]